MSKLIIFNSDAREKLKTGIDALCNAVKVTLGPKGRNVIIDEGWDKPYSTKDGVTVAKEIKLEDPVENTGAQLVKEVATKTGDAAGDGTTTSIVLAQAMITSGMKNVVAGANPMDLKRGIDKATKVVIASLDKQAEMVGEDYDKITQIGTISANGDQEIGLLFSSTMKKIGKDGIITVEESRTSETHVTEVNGMQFDRGYGSPYYVTNTETMRVEYDNPVILIYDRRISVHQEIIPLLEKNITKNHGRPILIIAEDFDRIVDGFLVANKLQGQPPLKVVTVKAPGFGDRRKAMLEDIAALTGGTVISAELGKKLEDAELSDLGSCDKIIVDKDNTTIVNGHGNPEDVKMRINMIRQQIENAMSDYDKEKLRERIAKLSKGVAILYVGAQTELELTEKKARVDDALHATQAAIEEGIVTGGGVAFVKAIHALENIKGENEDENTGIQIVRNALEAPIRTIAENAGVEGSVVFDKVKNGTENLGYNARTGKYEDLKKAGVIDPKKVARVALENAASVAGMILTTECVINEKPSEAANQARNMRGMM